MENKNTLLILLEKYPDQQWDLEAIAFNPNITIIDFIEEYEVFKQNNLVMDFIEKYPNKPWNWNIISQNFQIEFIEKYPDKPWNWNLISINPNITVGFIEKYFSKINFAQLSANKFTKQNKLYLNTNLLNKYTNLNDDIISNILKY